MTDNAPKLGRPNHPAPSDAKDAASASKEEPKRRGRRPGVAPKERPQIPADQFTILDVSQEERAEYKRRREERSEQQKAVDGLVMSVYKEWVKVGKPSHWAKMPVKVWPISQNFEETAEFYLRKAATLHGLKLVFGQRGIVRDHKIHLPFCVCDRKVEVEGAPDNQS